MQQRGAIMLREKTLPFEIHRNIAWPNGQKQVSVGSRLGEIGHAIDCSVLGFYSLTPTPQLPHL